MTIKKNHYYILNNYFITVHMSDFLHQLRTQPDLAGKTASDKEVLVNSLVKKICEVLMPDKDGRHRIWTRIKDLRLVGDPDFEGSELFTSRSTSRSITDTISLVKQFNIADNMSDGNDSWDEISKRLWSALWIDFQGIPLFWSIWAVAVIWENGIEHTSYNNTVFDSNGNETKEISWVARAYEDNRLKRMCLEKAQIAKIVHDTLALFDGNFVLQTNVLQWVITLLSEWDQYYRWPYFYAWKAYGVSAAHVDHRITEMIFDKIGKDNHDINRIAKEKFDKDNPGVSVWRVDLLASIFDELLAKLIAHSPRDWNNIIVAVAKEIQEYARRWELWKLC